MKLKMVLFSLAVGLGLFAPSLNALGQSQRLQIDLIQATLNGRPLLSMTVDGISDLLGRPTAVKDNRLIAELTGPQIYYHDAGVSFWFKPKTKDPTERLSMMAIYFSRAWDEKTKKFFEQFRGQITKNIDANWRADKTLSEFAPYNPMVETAEELDRQLRQTNIRGVPLHHLVRLNMNGIHCEPHARPCYEVSGTRQHRQQLKR